MHVMSLNLLTVVKVHLFNLGLPMNRYTFVIPSENQNAFRLLSICANAVYNVIQSLKDISSIRIFCKDIHETLKYVDELTEIINDKIKKKAHLSLSLSLLVDLLMHFDFPERMCMYQSLSLFSLFTLQKRLGSRSDPNGIQERMFPQFKNLCMR